MWFHSVRRCLAKQWRSVSLISSCYTGQTLSLHFTLPKVITPEMMVSQKSVKEKCLIQRPEDICYQSSRLNGKKIPSMHSICTLYKMLDHHMITIFNKSSQNKPQIHWDFFVFLSLVVYTAILYVMCLLCCTVPLSQFWSLETTSLVILSFV